MSIRKSERNGIQRWRFGILYGLMGLVFSFYAYRLFNLQVVQGKDFQEQAEINRTEDVNVQTRRGIIYDRNGFVLARNIASYNITITPAFLPDDPTVLGIRPRWTPIYHPRCRRFTANCLN